MTTSIELQPQLVLTAPGKAEWTDVPVPELSGEAAAGAPRGAGGAADPAATPAGAALVRPVAVATCDLDTAINAGRFPLPLPYALGHEFVAEVLSVGEAVTGVRPGDVVAVPFQINCGACRRCRRGQTGHCESVPRLSMYGLGQMGGAWGGAVSEVVRVPFADAMLTPLPAGVAPASVASLDNLADAWRTVGPYLPGLDDDRRVLVFGGLSVGLYSVAIARALGADVTYVDADPQRAAIAERLGASTADPAAKLDPHPLVVHTSSRVPGLLAAIRATGPGGTLVDTGIFREDVALPLFRMYSVGITFVTGTAQARRDIPAILDLVAAGRLDPSVVTAGTVDWDGAADAWSTHAGKLVVVR
jgi:threonine dehydrogenase-like Zn-dependent dehydrogenase